MGAIVLSAYDPGWPACFEAERAALLAAIGGALVDLEHIGSTAVPGLAARPTLDLLAGVRDLADIERCRGPLAGLAYVGLPGCEAREPGARFFGKRPGRGPGVQLALVEHGGPVWERLVLFRDFLRAHPKQALHYQQLKHVLAACCRDVEAYVDGKGGFVRVIEELARSGR